MKIRESTGKTSSLREVPGQEPRRVADSSGSSFKRHLKEFDHRNHEERIRALVSQIEEQGRKLSQKIDVAELKVYKGLFLIFWMKFCTTPIYFRKTVILTEEADTRFMPR